MSSRCARIVGSAVVLVAIAIFATQAAWERPLLRVLPGSAVAWLASRLETNAPAQLECGKRARATGDAREAADRLEAAAALAPDDPEAQALSALAHADAGAFTFAESAYQRAVRLSPAHPLVGLYEARRALAAAGPPEALKRTRTLLGSDPRLAEAWYVQAQAFFQVHNTRGALESLRAAVRLEPRNATYRRELAQVYQSVGALADAEDEALEALRLSRNEPLARLVLGRILLDRDASPATLERAASELNLAARGAKRTTDRHLALRELGRAETMRGNWKQAGAALEAASRLEPEDPGTLYHLSLAYRGAGDPRYREILARFRRAEAHQREERFLRGAVKESPTDLPTRQRLADFYLRAGNVREAEGVMADYRHGNVSGYLEQEAALASAARPVESRRR